MVDERQVAFDALLSAWRAYERNEADLTRLGHNFRLHAEVVLQALRPEVEARDAIIEECAVRADNYAAHCEANDAPERMYGALDIAENIRELKRSQPQHDEGKP